MNTQPIQTTARRARYRDLAMLSIDQVAAVILTCRKSGRCDSRHVLWRNNLIVFELAVCAGLRIGEMQGLKMMDIILDDAPRIELAGRVVPLNWTPWLLPDLQEYIDRRAEDDIHERSPLLVSLRTNDGYGNNCYGTIPTKRQIYSWFRTACMKPTRRKKNPVLIQDRQATPGVGRQSYIAAAIAAGIDQATVYAAAGISFTGPAAAVVTDPRFAGLVFRPTTDVQG